MVDSVKRFFSDRERVRHLSGHYQLFVASRRAVIIECSDLKPIKICLVFHQNLHLIICLFENNFFDIFNTADSTEIGR